MEQISKMQKLQIYFSSSRDSIAKKSSEHFFETKGRKIVLELGGQKGVDPQSSDLHHCG
jgi:hypothetical protein